MINNGSLFQRSLELVVVQQHLIAPLKLVKVVYGYSWFPYAAAWHLVLKRNILDTGPKSGVLISILVVPCTDAVV